MQCIAIRSLPGLESATTMRVFLSTLIILTLLGTVFPPMIVQAFSPMSILPRVHRLEVGESIPVPEVAYLYMLPEDPTAEAAVRGALHTAGIAVVPASDRDGSILDPDHLGVVVVTGEPTAEQKDSLPAPLAVALELVNSPQAPESYTLRVAEQGGFTWVILAGNDERGTFYAAQSLHQILEEVVPTQWSLESRSLPALHIEDGPAFRMRGIIEGFYGPPWTHQTRLDLLDFMGRYKLNTYVYAPKDDPYHRERWRDPYPPAAKERLSELIERAQQNRVDFVFAISPGLSIEYSSDADFHLLVQKTEAMWQLGVRHFALLLDDISPELTYASDRERFGSDLGVAHAYLVNRYNQYLREKGAGQLIMVPLDYYQPGMTPYRASLAEHLDSDVLIYWTGIGVVAPTITSQDAQGITQVYGNELLVWDNYPVNDYDRTRLLLGPLQGRDPDLADQVAGLTANPMNEGQASKVPLITVSSYLWNPQAYDAHKVWEAALRREGGSAHEALRRLAEASWESILHRDAMPLVGRVLAELWPMVESVIAAAGTQGDVVWDEAALLPLWQEFEAWQRVPAELKEGLGNRRLYQEIGPYAEKMRWYGVAGTHAIDALRALAQLAGDSSAVHARGELWHASYHLKGAMSRVAALEQQISVPHLTQFISAVQAGADGTFHVGEPMRVYTNFTSHYGDFAPEYMVDGDPTTFFWSDRGTQMGDFVGVDLGAVKLIDRISIQFNQQVGAWARPNDYPKSAIVQTSVDGHVWRNVSAIDQPSVTLSMDPVKARYVRALAMADQAEWLQVTEIAVHTVDDHAFVPTSPLPTKASLAYDSRLSSYITVPRGSVGEVLRLSATEPVRLQGVELFIRPDTLIPGGRVEVSTDGVKWMVLGELDGPHGWWSTEAFSGGITHVRLVATEPLEAVGFVHELVLHR